MGRAVAVRSVPLTPEAALALWTDTKRWPSFVEGFARLIEVSPDWPDTGGKVTWESTPEGRGRVTERVLERGPGRLVTEIFEAALHGTQTVHAGEDANGSRIEVELEYELSKYGPLRAVADVIFIRRALRDALQRTLRRFAVEADEEVGLR